MKYTFKFNEAKGICMVHVTGQHKRPDDSMALQKLARDLGNEHGCQRFLFDMTQADIISSTMGTFTTGTVPVDTDHTQVRQRIALVYSGDLSDPRFMENVAVNRGYQLRVFDRIDDAMEWLNPKSDNT